MNKYYDEVNRNIMINAAGNNMCNTTHIVKGCTIQSNNIEFIT